MSKPSSPATRTQSRGKHGGSKTTLASSAQSLSPSRGSQRPVSRGSYQTPEATGEEVVERLATLQQVLISGSKDKTARVWDVELGECLFKLEGHEGAVTCAAATPDLKWVLTGSEDCTAKLWALDRFAGAMRCAWTFRGHKDTLNSVRFSPDGKTVLTASNDCTAKHWSVRNGDCLCTYEYMMGPVPRAEFLPPAPPEASSLNSTSSSLGPLMQTWCREAEPSTRVYELESGIVLTTDDWEEEPPQTQFLSTCGRFAVQLDGGHQVTVEQAASGATAHLLSGHRLAVVCVAFLGVCEPLKNRTALPEELAGQLSLSEELTQSRLDMSLGGEEEPEEYVIPPAPSRWIMPQRRARCGDGVEAPPAASAVVEFP
eukprot:TRINITY_DN5462_c0_g4_i1.p1 TRINITY_DN5462_c0_g4~~TRINITY_DN5462_c0_g4_i1.p1  ORF type:complete len:372 (-),score=77.20 TRINITY_DN5462_c0_g4_i1:541-1656(-)